MYIFDYKFPGVWLDYPNSEWTARIGQLISHLENQFLDANASLNLFCDAQSQRSTNYAQDQETLEQFKQRMKQRRTVESQVHAEIPNLDSWEQRQWVVAEVDARIARERWARGAMPESLELRKVFIFAQAFIYALDGFDKFLKVLSKEEGAPPEIALLSERFGREFPDLRGVRNTNQHLEDRARGLGAGRNPKPLELQPPEVGRPGNAGALMLSSLMDDRYGCTMADGHFGEVRVSPHSMEVLRDIFCRALYSFAWKGGPQHRPR